MPHLIVRRPDGYQVYDLSKPVTTIGRSKKNDIVMRDTRTTVSREHAHVRRKNNRFILMDGSADGKKKSRNGIRIGKKKMDGLELAHNDSFQIEKWLFIFVEDDESPEEELQRVISQELEPGDRVVTVVSGADASASESSLGIATPFLSAIDVLFAAMDRKQLRETALDVMLGVIQAERGVILMKKEGEQDLIVWSQKGFEEMAGGLDISRSSVARVMTKGDTVLIQDGGGNDFMPESVVTNDLHSVLCTPLQRKNNIFGCVYLDKLQNKVSSADVQLLKVLARKAAFALAEKEVEEYVRLADKVGAEGNFVAKSEKTLKLYGEIEKMAPYRISVLLLGEPGTGKELAARQFHGLSKRKHKPFVAVNCAAINDALFESELFGHVKGAFTGADKDRKGHFEAAHGGTIFLDEISEMSPPIQAKLLRVLQEQEVVRVGDTKPIKVDVRVVAATNKNLQDESLREKIKFREDLYSRLEGVVLSIPPLRERPDDIVPMARYFLRAFREKEEWEKTPGMADETQKILRRYPWPRNVRELKNVLEYSAVFAEGRKIRPEHLPSKMREEVGLPLAEQRFPSLESLIRRHCVRAMEIAGGNKSRAARLLRIDAGRLRRKLQDPDAGKQ